MPNKENRKAKSSDQSLPISKVYLVSNALATDPKILITPLLLPINIDDLYAIDWSGNKE